MSVTLHEAVAWGSCSVYRWSPTWICVGTVSVSSARTFPSSMAPATVISLATEPGS